MAYGQEICSKVVTLPGSGKCSYSRANIKLLASANASGNSIRCPKDWRQYNASQKIVSSCRSMSFIAGVGTKTICARKRRSIRNGDIKARRPVNECGECLLSKKQRSGPGSQLEMFTLLLQCKIHRKMHGTATFGVGTAWSDGWLLRPWSVAVSISVPKHLETE